MYVYIIQTRYIIHIYRSFVRAFARPPIKRFFYHSSIHHRMALLRSSASRLGRYASTRVLCTTAAAAPGSGPNFRSLVALDSNTLRPYVQPNAYVSPSSLIFGSVTVNDKTCVHSGCTLRGDLGLIEVGALCILDESVTIRTVVSSDGPSTQDTVAAGCWRAASTSKATTWWGRAQ